MLDAGIVHEEFKWPSTAATSGSATSFLAVDTACVGLCWSSSATSSTRNPGTTGPFPVAWAMASCAPCSKSSPSPPPPPAAAARPPATRAASAFRRFEGRADHPSGNDELQRLLHAHRQRHHV